MKEFPIPGDAERAALAGESAESVALDRGASNGQITASSEETAQAVSTLGRGAVDVLADGGKLQSDTLTDKQAVLPTHDVTAEPLLTSDVGVLNGQLVSEIRAASSEAVAEERVVESDAAAEMANDDVVNVIETEEAIENKEQQILQHCGSTLATATVASSVSNESSSEQEAPATIEDESAARLGSTSMAMTSPNCRMDVQGECQDSNTTTSCDHQSSIVPNSSSASPAPVTLESTSEPSASMHHALAYVIGASPLMSPVLADQCASFVVSVTRNVDYITRLSIFGMDRLMLELTEQSAPKLAKQWLLEKMGRTQELSASRAVSRNRAFGDGAKVAEILVTPGRLLHMDRQDQGPARLFWALPFFYQEMLISPHMFHDHLPIRYVEDLLDAVRHICAPHYLVQADLQVRDQAALDPGWQARVLSLLADLSIPNNSNRSS